MPFEGYTISHEETDHDRFSILECTCTQASKKVAPSKLDLRGDYTYYYSVLFLCMQIYLSEILEKRWVPVNPTQPVPIAADTGCPSMTQG